MNINEIVIRLEKLGIEHDVCLQSCIEDNVDFVPASLKKMIPNGMYFIQNVTRTAFTEPTQSVILVNEFFESRCHLIQTSNPQLTHYKLVQAYHKPNPPGIHPTAIISQKAILGSNVSIGPYCIVGECVLEENVCLKNHVVIEDNVIIRKNTFIDSHSVIGASGLAWIWDTDGSRVIQPQLGGVIIEEDCVLATDITVVRGSLSEDTTIGKGTVIAHGTKIGHGAQIGSDVHMANSVSLAGNAIIGNSSFLGSGSIISSNITIPDHTIVGSGAMVNRNYEREYLTLGGLPAVIIRENNFESKPNGAPQPFKK
jgi:UDP-3-O-[3-hydroxymyristoyl] glucosamine N-acyltransferase